MFLIGLPLLTFCQSTALKVVDFKQSVCESDSDSRKHIRERIIDKQLTGGILRIQIGVWAICCADFRPISKLEKGTLFLDVEDTHKKESCECGCYYQFTYQIAGMHSYPLEINYKDKPIGISNERYIVYPPVFRLIRGDTVDFIDKYGLKQGKWHTDKDSLFVREFFIYRDGLVSRKLNLNASGKIKSETIIEILKEANIESHYGNKRKLIEYYDSGIKKKECDVDYHDIGLCKEWNEKGDLVYEGDFRK